MTSTELDSCAVGGYFADKFAPRVRHEQNEEHDTGQGDAHFGCFDTFLQFFHDQSITHKNYPPQTSLEK